MFKDERSVLACLDLILGPAASPGLCEVGALLSHLLGGA